MRYPLTVLGRVAAVAAMLGAAPMAAAQDYDPKINPADFTSNITNPFFNLPVGKRMVYEGENEDGEPVRIVITIGGETKTVMGVETLVYRDKEYEDGEMVEDTRDYLAQDKAGNVWYFGEDVDNYDDGKLQDHEGAWLAGVDGAKPGIWFPGNPQVGLEYRQEYYKGEAEDMGRVAAVNQTITIGMGIFEGCVKTFDWTPLEPDAQEEKFYCPAVGGVALIVDLTEGGREELVQMSIKDDDEDDDNEDDDEDDDEEDDDD